MLCHRAFTGVVGGERQLQIPGIAIDEAGQLTRAAPNVLFRIEWVLDLEPARGFRHQLHQPHGTTTAHRLRVVIGLDPYHRIDQPRIQPVLLTDMLHEPPKISPIERGHAGGRRCGSFSGGRSNLRHEQHCGKGRDHLSHPCIMTNIDQKGGIVAEPTTPDDQPFVDLMRRAGVAQAAVESFLFHFHRLAGGERGLLAESDIDPVSELPTMSALGQYRARGRQALGSVVVIKLNGGLGTSMGLDRAKSLLRVRDGLTFLDLIARQVLSLRDEVTAEIPLLLMNSFRTAEDSRALLAEYPDLACRSLPLDFLQHRVPKVDEVELLPAEHPEDPELEWCPPGHGDLYTALETSGVLDRLLEAGVEYAFVSNSDNLGAVIDSRIVGYMVEEGLDFILEAAERTEADRKGGHLCRLGSGRLALRESAQCPPDAVDAFQDVSRYGFFNTNNLWLRLPALAEALRGHGGFLPLPTLVNRKHVDPRDPASPPVFQLETAMGSAISFFEKAAAVQVPRRRFSPVKNTDDLLAARSDAYELTDDRRIALHPDRNEPPNVRLDPAFFKLIDDFESRFPAGTPSLRRCSSLTVEGDVTFGSAIAVKGEATIRSDRPAKVPDGAVLTGKITL